MDKKINRLLVMGIMILTFLAIGLVLESVIIFNFLEKTSEKDIEPVAPETLPSQSNTATKTELDSEDNLKRIFSDEEVYQLALEILEDDELLDNMFKYLIELEINDELVFHEDHMDLGPAPSFSRSYKEKFVLRALTHFKASRSTSEENFYRLNRLGIQLLVKDDKSISEYCDPASLQEDTKLERHDSDLSFKPIP